MWVIKLSDSNKKNFTNKSVGDVIQISITYSLTLKHDKKKRANMSGLRDKRKKTEK